MDTGLISSHRHLGLNAPVRDRIQYRKVTTCTILNDEKYISDWKNLSATADSPAKRVVDAYYGPSPIADRNATYSFSEWSQYYSFDQYSDTNPYQINVKYATAGDVTGAFSTFIPIAELALDDADIFLVFLSFSKVYKTPVSDPWFLAQTPRPYPTPDRIGPINETVYTRDRPVTTLACAEQHQICINSDSPSAIPVLERCTPLTGWYRVSTGPQSADSLNLTARQYATANRVFQSALDSSFANVVRGLAQRDTPLLARRSVQGLVGIGLPEDQWQQEARYWSSICTANLQRSVIDYSTGQFAADTSYINVTRSPAQLWLCQNQIIRGTSYLSFNFFVLIFILVAGLIIIIAGLTIEDCTATWRQRRLLHGRTKSSFRQDMWVKNGMLEMLRILFERRSRTIWGLSSNGIPISGPGHLMKVADLDRTLYLQVHELRPPKDGSWLSSSSTNFVAAPSSIARRFPSIGDVSESQIPANQADFEYHGEDANNQGASTVNYPDLRDHGEDPEGATLTQPPHPWGAWGERPRPVPQIDFRQIGRAY
ncbi:hypothetical protein CLAIMM_11813 [Cladophialophora immunda]|nr:hypothetical protein CLAIMM_11813 [Cladophialophora immunda]